MPKATPIESTESQKPTHLLVASASRASAVRKMPSPQLLQNFHQAASNKKSREESRYPNSAIAMFFVA